MTNFLLDWHTKEHCKRYLTDDSGERTLLTYHNQQEHDIQFILVQLALLGYIASLAYVYKNNKTAVTVTATTVAAAAFCVAFARMITSGMGTFGLDMMMNLILLKSPDPSFWESQCRDSAMNAEYMEFPEEIAIVTAAVAAVTISTSLYYAQKSFFSKKAPTMVILPTESFNEYETDIAANKKTI